LLVGIQRDGTTSGRITSFHRGGGGNRRLRRVDFRRREKVYTALVIRYERDPFRSAPLALICYRNGILAYILGAHGLNPNHLLDPLKAAHLAPGNAAALANIMIGTMIHNIEQYCGQGGSLVRAARRSSTNFAEIGDWTTSRLPSGETRVVHNTCFATTGRSNLPQVSSRFTMPRLGNYAGLDVVP